MVLTVFLIIISGFYAMVNLYRPPVVSYLEEDTIRVTELLINHPGSLWNGSKDWEEYEYKDLKNNLSTIGLALNATQSYGILDITKILKLTSNTATEWYEFVRDVLKVKENGYHINITITNLTPASNEKYYFGNETAGKYGFCWKRIVLVYNFVDGSYTPFALEVRLAKRG